MTADDQITALARAFEAGLFDDVKCSDEMALVVVQQFLGEPLLPKVLAGLRARLPRVPRGRSWRLFLRADAWRVEVAGRLRYRKGGQP